jgi:hypothetical protein
MPYGEEVNPYAAPTADIGVWRGNLGAETDAERIRKHYLKHEASVQAIGIVYYLLGGIGALGTLACVISSFADHERDLRPLGIAAGFGLVGAGFIAVGRGLRALRRWVRIPVGILSGIGLVWIPPIGTIINGYFLYLVFCEKGRTVFSLDYRAVIGQTPHIRYRSSLWIWILGAVIIAAMIVLFLACYFPQIFWTSRSGSGFNR